MTQHNHISVSLEHAKWLATEARSDIISQWLDSKGEVYGDLDELIYERAHEDADSLCIYTWDNVLLLRTLEDAGEVDNYTDLLCGEEDHDRRTVVIAYTFWSQEIACALHDLFAEQKDELIASDGA